MNIILNIAYRTRMGEELVLHSLTRSGKEDVHRMSTLDGEQWHATLEADPADGEVKYFYALERAGKELRREWTLITHRLDLSATKATDYLVFDYWVDIPEDAYLYTSAYTDCIHLRTVSPVSPSAYDSTLRVAVRAPQLLDHQRLTLVGSAGALGCWNPKKAIPMTEHNHNEWVVDVDANSLGAAIMSLSSWPSTNASPMCPFGKQAATTRLTCQRPSLVRSVCTRFPWPSFPSATRGWLERSYPYSPCVRPPALGWATLAT